MFFFDIAGLTAFNRSFIGVSGGLGRYKGANGVLLEI